MKKVITKIVIIFMIIIFLFEFTFSSNVCHAAGIDVDTVNSITNLMGGLVSIVLWIPRILAVGVSWIFNVIMTESLAESCGVNSDKGWVLDGATATPFMIFFNKYKLFDVNFFDLDNGNSDLIHSIRKSVAEWFYIMRTFSAAILLCILIYVGIRMALSTIAEDKAKYKKMLWDWCCSLALIFVLQYLAIFTISVNNAIVNFLKSAAGEDISEAMTQISTQATLGVGIGSIVATLVYCMMTFQTIAFMLTYLQRMLKVGFLLIISPLISITYSIDKIGDGKAQALNTWLKEFVYTILIQPFHCIMYLAFVNTAVTLLRTGGKGAFSSVTLLLDSNYNQLANGFLVILCLKFINDGEKAIRKIFNFQDDASMTSMAAGAALGMAAIKNAKKIGGATAKGLNLAKGMGGKLATAYKNDVERGTGVTKIPGIVSGAAEKIGNKYSQTGIGKATKAIGDKASAVGHKIGNGIHNGAQNFANKHTKIISGAKTIGKGAEKAGNAIGKGAMATGRFVKNGGDKVAEIADRVNHSKAAQIARRSMPAAMAMMGAAMAYSTGSTSAMEAFGIGSALKSGTEEFFQNSSGTIGNELDNAVEQTMENSLEQATLEAKEMDEGDVSALDEATSDEEKEEFSNVDNDLNSDDETKREAAKAKIEDWKENDKTKFDKYQNHKKIQKFENTYGCSYKDLASSDSDVAERAREQFRSYYFSEKGKLGSEGAISAIATDSHGKDKLLSKKNEILQKILALEKSATDSSKKQGNSDSDTEQSLTSKDTSSAERTMKSITEAIDRNVIAGGGNMSTSDIVKQQLGMEDETSEAYRSIYKSALEYEQMAIGARAQNILGNADNAGMDSDVIAEKSRQRMISSHGVNG